VHASGGASNPVFRTKLLGTPFSVSQEEAATAVADDPATYEEVWRPGARKSLVGLRVDLAKVSEERVQELVEHAWRNKAPKRVVSAYDAQ